MDVRKSEDGKAFAVIPGPVISSQSGENMQMAMAAEIPPDHPSHPDYERNRRLARMKAVRKQRQLRELRRRRENS